MNVRQRLGFGQRPQLLQAPSAFDF